MSRPLGTYQSTRMRTFIYRVITCCCCRFFSRWRSQAVWTISWCCNPLDSSCSAGLCWLFRRSDEGSANRGNSSRNDQDQRSTHLNVVFRTGRSSFGEPRSLIRSINIHQLILVKEKFERLCAHELSAQRSEFAPIFFHAMRYTQHRPRGRAFIYALFDVPTALATGWRNP